MKTILPVLLAAAFCAEATAQPDPTMVGAYGPTDVQWVTVPCESPENVLGDYISYSPEDIGIRRDSHTGVYADGTTNFGVGTHHLRIFASCSFDYSCIPEIPSAIVVIGTQPDNTPLTLPNILNAQLLTVVILTENMEYKGLGFSRFPNGLQYHEFHYDWEPGPSVPSGLNVRFQCAFIGAGTAFVTQALHFVYP